MKATSILSGDDKRQIEATIAEAESTTAAEFVCAVATESGRYDRAEAMLGLFGALIGLGIADVGHHFATTQPGDFSISALAFGWQALAVVVGFIGGVALGSCWHGLRRLFIPAREIDVEVQQAAWHIFASASLRRTIDKNGVLIYVSLAERRVVILPDDQAREALGDEPLAALRDQAIEHLRAGRFVECFTTTVESAAPRLGEALPADREVNPNELADQVLIFHPRPADA